MREIQPHESVMRSHQGLVDLEIGRAATETLDVDTPFLGIQAKGFLGSPLAGEFNGIDVLVTTIVSGAWVSFRVFVGHGRPQRIEDSARSDILGGNEEDRLSLPLDFLFLLSQVSTRITPPTPPKHETTQMGMSYGIKEYE